MPPLKFHYNDEHYMSIPVEEFERLHKKSEFCPICGHEWRRHDPEDGMCDAPSNEEGVFSACRCGREIEFQQKMNARLSRKELGK